MADTRRIDTDDDGIRLDRWFRRHYPALAHGRLEALLRTGQIRLDGKRAKAGDRIATGQSVRLPPQIENRPGVAQAAKRSGHGESPRDPLLRERILHMDDCVIVLDKPAGLATQGGSGLTRHIDGMLETLRFGKNQKPRLVHRLDRDTSGVLLIARTAAAAAFLGKALQQRDAKKLYWALTRGVPKKARGMVTLALAKKRVGERGREERVMVAGKEESGRRAATAYEVLGSAGEEFAWVAARPVTGRTHQIRVHLQSLGTPIVGDFKYGGPEARGRGAIENRLHLHARAIDIAHPAGGRLRAVAPLPPHMQKSWSLLGFDPDSAADPFEKGAR